MPCGSSRSSTDHGFEHDVPSCPGWNLGDLAWHRRGVWNFWGRVVAEGVTSVDVLRTWEETPRPSDAFLLDWVTAAHTSLFSALAAAPTASGGVDLDGRQP